jgi:hypothetical protein
VALSDRIPYQAQVDRPKLTLPGGKKLAVWVILNVEEWRIENAMPRTVLSPPMGQPLLPDVPNWSWHEYGMRAGFWRQFKALTDRKMPVTLALNANVCNTYPRLKRCTDQFDRLYLEGASNARIMAVSIHPYITGVPHRIKYLEALLDYVLGHDGVALMTASEIGDWYRAEMAKS